MSNKFLNNGFTLIELMIVVAVIGILSAIAVPSYKTYIEKANLAEASTTLTNLSQKIAERKLQSFNGSFVQSDLSAIVQQQVGNSNKYNFGVKCQNNTDCSTYHLYAEPKSGSNLKKSVWMGNNSGLYICDISSVSGIVDASSDANCTKQ
ncbi:type IV pilin protein [Snodgrassella sp. ESL0253]|uniref:type IV pilin protein n=1 Tax=Snodgrassella sp. ESL0253 TaxID=2705031 RepID=UPI001583215A|nr:prepilin-type N-terminal cleavage/methylation domain-containing protein [Snodgrassella sp. ESL0253]NUE66875.1 prepilin-type N-terminal cleavage/methylation domain-containing protein [Snodgrassella sp. ESL0253]